MKKRLFTGLGIAAMTIALPAAARTVSGNLYYLDHLPTVVSGGSCLGQSGMTANGNKTVRSGMPVQIKVCTPTCSVVASTTTGSNGYFAATISDALAGELKISVQATLPAAYISGTPWFDLTHGTIAAGSSTISVSLAAPKGNGAEQLNLLDVLGAAHAYALAKKVSPAETIAQVKVTFPGGPPEYKPGTDEIVMPPGFPFEDGLVLHEYGHHLQAEIGGLFVHQPLGHGECVDYGFEKGGAENTETKANAFAWKEGFATYFGEAVRLTDTNRISNWCFLTRAGTDAGPTWCGDFGQGWVANNGRRTEWAVYATLIDLHDTSQEYSDRTFGTTAAPGHPQTRDIIFQIFDAEQDYSTPDIAHFAWGFQFRNLANSIGPESGRTYLGSASDIDRILASHGFFLNGTPSGHHPLPEYKILSAWASPTVIPAGGSTTFSANIENLGWAFGEEWITFRAINGTAISGQTTFFPFTSSGTTKAVTAWASGAGEGMYSVEVGVDPYDRIPEPSSANNYKSVNIWVYVCGNGNCYTGEDCGNCPQDCGECDPCGDGYCDYPENQYNCPEDCYFDDPPPCFVAGTPITMADGSVKPIEQVGVGDRVLSYDTDLGQLIPGDVTTTFVHPESKRLVVLNGDLVTTAEHPFYSSGAWVRADALTPGDPLVRATFAPSSATPMLATSEVSTLETLPDHATTYNFEVARVHNYFAGGLLVHNIKPGE